MSGPGQYLYLLGLLAVPGLLLLMLLMAWLEQHFVHRLMADDIARLLQSEAPIDDLEARVAASAQPLFTGVQRP
jgi:hypothetical protein